MSIGADLDKAHKDIAVASGLIITQVVKRRFSISETEAALRHIEAAKSQLKALISGTKGAR